MPDDRTGAQITESDREAEGPLRAGRLARATTTSTPRGAAYEGAMEAIMAVLISVGAGYWADQHFGTGPVWLIVGAIAGFAAMVLRLLRMGRLVEAAAHEAAQPSVASRSSGGDEILGGTERRPSGEGGEGDQTGR